MIDGHIYCAGHTDHVDNEHWIEIQRLEAGAKIFIKSWDDEQFDRIVPFFYFIRKNEIGNRSSRAFLILNFESDCYGEDIEVL